MYKEIIDSLPRLNFIGHFSSFDDLKDECIKDGDMCTVNGISYIYHDSKWNEPAKTWIEPKEKPTLYYACLTDWTHERDYLPIRLYKSLEKLKRDRDCVNECGIIQLEIKETIIQDSDFSEVIPDDQTN